MPPLFSVVVPTHQAAALIGDTLRRVLAQTCQDFEIIVLDNGSTDGTDEVVASLGDPRIRYTWQEDSGLPANSRNVAVSMATGEWVAFLDADDVWYPAKLERVAAAIEADPSLDVICHDVLVTREGREVSRRAYRPDTARMFDELLYRGNTLTTSATCVRRSALQAAGPFSEDRAKRTVEDFDLWLRLAEAGRRFLFIAEPLGEWVLFADSASANLVAHYDALFVAYDEWFSRLAAQGKLDVSRALRRRVRARLAMVRDTFAASPRVSLGALVRLPGELLHARSVYRDAGSAR